MENNNKQAIPLLIEDLGMIFPTDASKHKARYGIYLCVCGNTFKAGVSYVKRGSTNSCGCYKKQRTKEANTSHGLSSHPLFKTWTGMIQRTTNKNIKNFKHYGARGIMVCQRWQDISLFIEDMYPSYQDGLSIDRIDNSGNYEPSNCRWATNEVQHRNTRVLISTNKSGYRGVSYSKHTDKWQASISVSGKRKYIGLFNTALEAASAYDSYVRSNGLEHSINSANNC